MKENTFHRNQRVAGEKFRRGSSYRSDFIRAHPGFHGFYLCRYCGKPLKKDKMQVDHRIPVHKAETSWLYRRLLSFYPEGVNDVRNLVPSCGACNKRKGHKTGIWLLLGYTGVVTGPMFRLTVTGFVVYVAYLLISTLIR